MPIVSETIPAALQPDVDAALAWFNREQPIPFEVTGILDADAALAKDTPRELKLVLCGGVAAGHGFDFPLPREQPFGRRDQEARGKAE